MNILLVKTSAIGDVIHTLPALNALRSNYPSARITWFIEEAASNIIDGHPALDRVLVSRRKSWIRDIKNGSFFSVFKQIISFIKELRDTEYELVIDFQSLLKSGIFIGLARGKRKVGYGRGMEHSEFSYIFLNERIPPVNMDNHAVSRELMLLEAIGVKYDKVVFDLPIEEQNRQEARELLAKHDVSSARKLVAINPMCKWDTKLWQNDKFAKVADRLVDSGVDIVFTGSRDDVEILNSIISQMKKRSVNLAGATSLKTLAALYQKADAVISTDTGPMHIAAAVGTPVVALFGPTKPGRTGPYGENNIVLQEDLECVPCLKRTCGSVECMNNISVDMVVEATQKLLNNSIKYASSP